MFYTANKYSNYYMRNIITRGLKGHIGLDLSDYFKVQKNHIVKAPDNTLRHKPRPRGMIRNMIRFMIRFRLFSGLFIGYLSGLVSGLICVFISSFTYVLDVSFYP